MAEYELSKTIIPYLDRHLSLPLLAHLVETNIFPAEEVQVAQYELAKGTNMFDYAETLFKQIHPDEESPKGALSLEWKMFSMKTSENSVPSFLSLT